MKNLFSAFILFFLCFLFIHKAPAQEADTHRAAILATSQKIFDTWQKGDFQAFGELLHPQYEGWSNHDSLPVKKENLIARYRKGREQYRLEVIDRTPAGVVITGDGAVFHYSFRYVMIPADNSTANRKEITGKTSEFYVKKGKQWLLTGDMSDYQIRP